MDYDQLVQLGLNQNEDLQLIFSSENANPQGDESVTLIYATLSKLAAESKLKELQQLHTGNQYTIACIPLNVELNNLANIKLSIHQQ